MQSLVQSTKEKPSDTLFVHIYNGDDLNVFEYYEDDGSTMNYKNGLYFKRNITFDPAKKCLEFSKADVHLPSDYKNIMCIFHGFEEIKEVSVNGEKILRKWSNC